MKDKILILGSEGFIGTRIRKLYYDHRTHWKCDIANKQDVEQAITRHQPNIIINCAGKTGNPNIDWCEENQLATLHSNVIGPLVLAEECSAKNIYMVHFSSGCIFEDSDQRRGFTEEDEPNFNGSFYSRTKANTDRLLSELPILIIRIRMPFDSSDHPKNLINKLINYKQVLDAQNSMTHIPDLLVALDKLISQRVTGIFNIVNADTTSPYHIMREYARIVDPTHSCSPITAEQLNKMTKARRSICTLSIDKLLKYGISMPPILDAIDLCLKNMASIQQKPGSN